MVEISFKPEDDRRVRDRLIALGCTDIDATLGGEHGPGFGYDARKLVRFTATAFNKTSKQQKLETINQSIIYLLTGEVRPVAEVSYHQMGGFLAL